MIDPFRTVVAWRGTDCVVNALVVDLGFPSLLYPCRIIRQDEGIIVKVATPGGPCSAPLCLGQLSTELLGAEQRRWESIFSSPIAVAVLFDRWCARTPLYDTNHVRHLEVLGEAGIISPTLHMTVPGSRPLATVFGKGVQLEEIPCRPLPRRGQLAAVAQSRSRAGTFGIFESLPAGTARIIRFESSGPVAQFPAA